MVQELECGLALMLAFACGSTLAWCISCDVVSAVRRAGHGSGAGRFALKKLAGPLFPLAKALSRNARVSSFAEGLSGLLRDKGVGLAATEALSTLLGACAMSAIFAGLVAQSPVAAFAVPALLAALAVSRVRARVEKSRDAVRDAVPDALHAMSACFQAGFSLLQTFRQLADETKGPLGKRFQSAVSRLETGQPATSAIEELRRDDASSELAFIAVALDVQHEAGGSMRQVLDAARDTVEGECELRRSLKVQTAQARLSARVVTAMPFVLVALFSLISDGFLEPFFTSIAGMGLLFLAIAMEVAGVLAVRRMLSVEVV